MRRQDMTGKRFGMLTVIKRIKRSEAPSNYPSCLVRCDCGNEKIVNTCDLKLGYITSCGCVRKDSSRDRIINDNVLGHYDGTCVSFIRSVVNSKKTKGISTITLKDGSKRYCVSIYLRNKKISLGRYKNYDDAVKVRRDAEQQYFIPIIKAWDEAHKNDQRGNDNAEK